MKTISKIAYSNDKKNKTRSILIMVAICLTTMLLTIISTIGNGIIQLQKDNAADSYGSNYGMFMAVKDTQLQEMKRHSAIDSIGIMRTAGILKGNEKGGFVSTDQAVRDMLPYNQEYLLSEGSYPENSLDIAASEAFFQSQGYSNVKIGDIISLDYRAGMKDEYQSKDFIVSGILFDRKEYTVDASYVVFCSPNFYNDQIAENEREANVYFTLSDSVQVSMNNLDQQLGNIAASCGIDQKNLIVNEYYVMWILEPSYEMIIVCGLLIAGIVLFSVVVIYNIFQVGIAQKIQEYGKIKALGATRRQMKQLIFREGMFLALLSIPVGLVLGFLVAKVSFGWLIQQGNLVSSGMQNHKVPLFSIAMIFISLIVSLITVMLALRKPMKIVSKISPIEATRYLENSTNKNQGMRRGKKNVSVFSMVMASVTGNKKRTIGTIFTMGLSCVLFVTISNVVGNIDTDYEARRVINHGQIELRLDYSLAYDEAYPENNLNYILKKNPLNASLLAEIKNIPGVKDVLTREVASVDLKGTKYPVSIVNKEDFEQMRWDGDIGCMDYDEVVKNGDIFFGWSMWLGSDGYSLDSAIAFEFDNGTGKFAYQGKIAGAFVSADTYLVIPEEVYRATQPEGTSYGYVWVDCDEKDAAFVEQNIRDMIEGTSYIKIKTYHNELQTAEFASRMMKMGCYLFMAIVGLIGFMNLANTMIISITTKKQEYGVLQAIGMTNKQLNLSLQLQGLLFTLGTISVALIVGLPVGHMLFMYMKKNAIFGMNEYHIPFVPIIVMILVIALLQLILSYVLSHNLKKESLVERIRYQG